MKLAYAVATPDTTDEQMLALRGDPAESFRVLGELGYAGIDLMIRDPARIDARRLQDAAEKNGLRVASVSTGQVRKEDGLELCHPDDAQRARAVDRGRAVIDFAAGLGAQVNIGTFRGTLRSGPERANSLLAAKASAEVLLEHAQPLGVRIAFEPQCRYISNWLNTISETRGFIAGLSRPGSAILLDIYHTLLEEPSIYAAIIRVAPVLTMVQVSDSNRLPPGDGQLHFAEIVRVLRAVGYDGYLSVEALQRPTPKEAAARSARHLRPLLEEGE